MSNQEVRLTGDVLITANEVAKMCGLSRSSLYKLVSGGRAPKPVKLGRASRWSRQVILDWIAAGCPRRDRGK